MNIRLEQADDINTICDVIYLAFENHPHHQLGAKPTEHLIVNDLRTAGELILSLVAQDETGIVGHIAFSPVMVANKHCNFLVWSKSAYYHNDKMKVSVPSSFMQA